MEVEVSLDKTAHANASAYFQKMKANQVKLGKTFAATAKAAAGAARKGDKAAAKQKTKKLIAKERVKKWWEKFRWFRTSAGDVVLQGKDAQSSEIILRRIMCMRDVFVFSEIDGALPCLLRPMNADV
uniref:Nuclear export mediator factor NEMF n=1 Tax=Lygus hesperus TaxID=30085 RepID=A0A0A9XWT9_LYGHE